MMGWVKKLASKQCVDLSGVKPEIRFRDNHIWLNSAAGNIEFFSKDWRELCKFRNDAANRFCELISCSKDDIFSRDEINRRMFILYRNIRSKYKVKYRANLRTRLKGIVL